ncbi:MAG: 50S ribosomal protein L23 [Alphaproteobacteria bacterium]
MSRARTIRGPAPKITPNQMAEILRAPVISEKSTLISEHNQVTFRVAIDADKAQIKQAVEGLFGVNVLAVNTIRQKGKVKRFRGVLGKRNDTKKAIVTLADPDSRVVAAGL